MATKKRGKKFTAAEKHFMDKELKLRREIKSLREVNSGLLRDGRDLRCEVNKLRKALEIQIEVNRKLQEYTKMSNEELERALARDKSLAEVMPFISQILKGGPLF